MRKQLLRLVSLATLISLVMNVPLALAANGEVSSEQTISDTAGGFSTTLDDSDYFGQSVAVIGDLDNDGNEDVAVGAYRDDDGTTSNGAVYILFLDSDGTVKSEQKISDTEGDFGATFYGGETFGNSVAGIGDLDNDGFEDIVVGAPNDDDGGNSHGALYVLFLGIDGKVDEYQKISDTEGDFGATLSTSDNFGWSVANIGDLDNDNVVDIAVGAKLDNDGGSNRGAVYVLFLGTDGKVDGYQKISDTAGDFGASFTDADNFGYSVDGIGDLDDDGIEDIVVGVVGDDDGGSSRGAIYVLFLGVDGAVDEYQKISDLEGDFDITFVDADYMGAAVAGIGDLDQDGVEDIAVGLSLEDTGGSGNGSVYILFMNDDGTVSSYQQIAEGVGNLSATFSPNERFGEAIDVFTDLDGDGIPDLFVGAVQADDGGGDRGAAHVLFLEGVAAVSNAPVFPGWSMLVAFMVMFFVADRYKERFQIMERA
jgi:hypothetical protein